MRRSLALALFVALLAAAPPPPTVRTAATGSMVRASYAEVLSPACIQPIAADLIGD